MVSISKLFCFFGKHEFSDWSEEGQFVSTEGHRRQRHCLHCSHSQEEVVPHSWEKIDEDLDICLECQTAIIIDRIGQKITGVRYIRVKACSDKELRSRFNVDGKKLR